jgi:hypothetical protein
MLGTSAVIFIVTVSPIYASVDFCHTPSLLTNLSTVGLVVLLPISIASFSVICNKAAFFASPACNVVVSTIK